MGRRPRPRGPVIDAVLVIDKTSGPSSHDAVAAVRRIVGHSRVGHTGTLDPLATGVLIMGVGRATRLVPYLQGGKKTYVATAQLGVATDSYDAMGAITQTVDAIHITGEDVAAALTSFVGEITQLPPMVSAVKVDGERLYAKARRGEEVTRPVRHVEVFSLTLDSFTASTHPNLTFTVTCGPGTYIRTIAHDLGVALGVGAHLTALRRTANGGFTDEQAVTVDTLTSENWRDYTVDMVDALATHMPVHVVENPEAIRLLTHGGKLTFDGAPGPVVAVQQQTDGTRRLIGIYDGDEAATRKPAFVMLRPEDLE